MSGARAPPARIRARVWHAMHLLRGSSIARSRRKAYDGPLAPRALRARRAERGYYRPRTAYDEAFRLGRHRRRALPGRRRGGGELRFDRIDRGSSTVCDPISYGDAEDARCSRAAPRRGAARARARDARGLACRPFRCGPARAAARRAEGELAAKGGIPRSRRGRGQPPIAALASAAEGCGAREARCAAQLRAQKRVSMREPTPPRLRAFSCRSRAGRQASAAVRLARGGPRPRWTRRARTSARRRRDGGAPRESARQLTRARGTGILAPWRAAGLSRIALERDPSEALRCSIALPGDRGCRGALAERARGRRGPLPGR